MEIKMITPFKTFNLLNETNSEYPVYNKIKEFVESLNATKSTEWVKGFFVLDNYLYFTLLPHFNGRDFYLYSVYVERLYRKQGKLKFFLNSLFDYCNKYNMKIYIDPNPLRYLEDPYISKLELVNIYKRFGFVESKKMYMVKNHNNTTYNEIVP